MDTIDLISKTALSRRAFFAGAGSVAAATALAGCSDDGTVTIPVASTSYTDFDILNFALNTEYFEAEFYLRAATGSGLPASLIGSNPGTVTATTLTKVPNATTAQQNIMNELAYTEQQHIATLISAITSLGGTPISRPTLNYDAGFAGIVAAANAISNSSLPAIPATFNPTASFDAYAMTSGGFEDLGVTAYTGAAPLLSAAAATNGVLAAAGGILAKEAYSAGMMRLIINGNAITQGSTAYPYGLYFNRLVALYNALGGTTAYAPSTPMAGFTTSAATIASVTASGVVQASSSNAVGTYRSTDQVLHIAYGTYSTTAGSTTPSAGVSAGGFFPNGFNGNIKITQS